MLMDLYYLSLFFYLGLMIYGVYHLIVPKSFKQYINMKLWEEEME